MKAVDDVNFLNQVVETKVHIFVFNIGEVIRILSNRNRDTSIFKFWLCGGSTNLRDKENDEENSGV